MQDFNVPAFDSRDEMLQCMPHYIRSLEVLTLCQMNDADVPDEVCQANTDKLRILINDFGYHTGMTHSHAVLLSLHSIH